MSITSDPAGSAAPKATVSRPGLGARIRNWFLTGIVIAGPLLLTAYFVWWFVDSVDNAVRRLVPERFWPDSYLPFPMPGFGVIFAFIGLTLLGFLTANLVGRTAISVGEGVLARTPVIRSIYKALKQIFETLFSQTGTSFRKVGLVEFPNKGAWSIVFFSAPPSGVIESHIPNDGVERISVFLPCVPNPTTGFYFYVPAAEVIELPVSPEDAAKLIMSCGVIQPEGQTALAAMAEAARRAHDPESRIAATVGEV